jgi:hypothetical protein
MHPSPKSATVLPFPTASRNRREHLLRVASAAVPLLQALVAAGNATMVARIFDALGALSADHDALARLDAIRQESAEVVVLSERR